MRENDDKKIETSHELGIFLSVQQGDALAKQMSKRKSSKKKAGKHKNL